MTALLVHEVDAMRCHEWRLLYVLRDMEDETARRVFILLHWPLSIVLVAPFVLSRGLAAGLALIVALFAIVHLGLHLRLRNARWNEFRGALSYTPIWAAALFGAGHVVVAVT